MSRYQSHAFHAERRRAMEQLRAQEPVGNRLYGWCEICETVHRHPDVKYLCQCGWTRCARRVEELGTTCWECGREIRMVGDGE